MVRSSFYLLSPWILLNLFLATTVRRFLDNTKSQLTYHGLFHLATTLAPGSLVALFRSSHLSVLYKSKGDEPALYTLVTDQVFLQEPSVVWERLEDIDGGWSTFVDSEFVRASPAGGDFAGQSAEDTLRASERLENQYNGDIDPFEWIFLFFSPYDDISIFFF